MPIRQAFAWGGFAKSGIAPEALIRGAAEIGFAGIEMVPKEHWPLLRDQGLTMVSLAGHPLNAPGLNDPAAFAAVEKATLASLADAVAWNIPYVICFSGFRESRDDETSAPIVAEHLKRLAPAFEETEVTLVMELLNSKVNHPDYQADHTGWGAAVCARVNSPRVKLLYDIYHMQIMEGDLIRTIRENHGAIAHYHTAGNPGRNDLDADQEINYPAVIRAVAATGHAGYIGHEFSPKGEPLAALRAAFELTERALADAG